MSPALPQELLDHVVDNVHAEVRFRKKRHWADVLALLRAGRCFGARCRKHMYCSVCIDLEITPPHVFDKTLDVSSLRFMELVRHTPSLAGLVKNVSYGLYYELDDIYHITSTTAWHALREFSPYLTRLDSVALDCNDSRIDPLGFLHMCLDTELVKAIGQIIPSCPFHKLRLSQMDLLPIHLVDLLSYCPSVISLDILNVSTGHELPEDRNIVRPVVPSKIKELMVSEADTFLREMASDEACLALCASVRRIVFPSWDLTEHVWGPLGDFIPRLRALEVAFFHLWDDDLGTWLPVFPPSDITYRYHIYLRLRCSHVFACTFFMSRAV